MSPVLFCVRSCVSGARLIRRDTVSHRLFRTRKRPYRKSFSRYQTTCLIKCKYLYYYFSSRNIPYHIDD